MLFPFTSFQDFVGDSSGGGDRSAGNHGAGLATSCSGTSWKRFAHDRSEGALEVTVHHLSKHGSAVCFGILVLCVCLDAQRSIS